MEAEGNNDAFFTLLEKELIFSFTRSSGPGGQHVNKVNTRVELKFHVNESEVLTPEQKEKILHKLKNRISRDGILTLASQEERSQLKNKQLVIERFIELITHALKPGKKRVPTRPSEVAKILRMEQKRKLSERKQGRRKPENDDEI